MALPRIASARVVVEWPDTVRIAVTEELPLMLFTSGDGPTAKWVTVSNHGRVIDQPTPEAAAGAVTAGAARVRVDDVSKLRLGSDLPTTLADVVIVFDQMPDTLRPEFVDATLTPEGTLRSRWRPGAPSSSGHRRTSRRSCSPPRPAWADVSSASASMCSTCGSPVA